MNVLSNEINKRPGALRNVTFVKARLRCNFEATFFSTRRRAFTKAPVGMKPCVQNGSECSFWMLLIGHIRYTQRLDQYVHIYIYLQSANCSSGILVWLWIDAIWGLKPPGRNPQWDTCASYEFSSWGPWHGITQDVRISAGRASRTFAGVALKSQQTASVSSLVNKCVKVGHSEESSINSFWCC